MLKTLRADRPTDHPSRENTDHANLDPRRHPKHPKSATPRPSDRSRIQ
jgi:hypothetical protein